MPNDGEGGAPGVSSSAHVAPPSATLGKVSVKPSPFWKKHPDLWFANVEAQFELAGITQDRTKYCIIVGALDDTSSPIVSDIIANPPDSNRYRAIRQALISRISGSENQKLKQLLSERELGDLQPSQLLRELKALNQSRLDMEMLKSLWLRRLPAHIQAILSCNPGSLDELANCADKIAEVNSKPELFHVSADRSTNLAIDRLTENIAALTKLVNAQFASRRSFSRNKASRSTSRERGRSDPKIKTHKNYCWYHFRFGEKAIKCVLPCRFQSDAANAATSSSSVSLN